MNIASLSEYDVDDVVALWREVDLTRPWNDPVADYRRAMEGPTSTVLGATDDGRLVGSIMVGHDGHRGWVYYLAVRAVEQRHGVGTALMSAAEAWLRERGAVKVQLMLRSENTATRHFYDALGYEFNDVSVLSRRLDH
jgi:ribosomal protein S18 acetylase RimI-like enzyme